MLDSPVPTEVRHPAADRRTRRRPTSPTGCASRSSTSYGAGQAFGGGLRSSRPSTSTFRPPPSRRSPSNLAGLGPTAAVVVIDNGSGEVLAMVGGQDFDESPVQPRHQRPAPARLLVQAVHARDRAQGGPLARRGLRVGAAAAPVRGDDRARTARRRRSPTSSRSTTTTTTTSAAPRSRPPRPTPTTPSTPSSASRSGSTTSSRPPTSSGSPPSSTTTRR